METVNRHGRFVFFRNCPAIQGASQSPRPISCTKHALPCAGSALRRTAL